MKVKDHLYKEDEDKNNESVELLEKLNVTNTLLINSTHETINQ
jgi:hypothetical protein